MKTKFLVISGLFTALVVIGAFIKIPFVFGVPLTLQNMFVFIAALVLGKRGWVPVLVYLAAGLAGVPVFAYGGGIGYILHPTFGYLLGFLVAALLIGFLRVNKHYCFVNGLVCVAGVLAIYAIGIPYLYVIKTMYLNTTVELHALLKNAMLVFLPGDIVKAGIAVFVAYMLKKHGVVYED